MQSHIDPGLLIDVEHDACLHEVRKAGSIHVQPIGGGCQVQDVVLTGAVGGGTLRNVGADVGERDIRVCDDGSAAIAHGAGDRGIYRLGCKGSGNHQRDGRQVQLGEHAGRPRPSGERAEVALVVLVWVIGLDEFNLRQAHDLS